MNNIAIFDIETLAVSSESVILSAAITFLTLGEQHTMESLMRNTHFVKFDAEEQITKYKRKIHPDTMVWWKIQCDSVKQMSLIPSESDLPLAEGIDMLRNIIANNCDPKKILVFSRGNIDQMVIDSAARAIGDKPLFPYYVWRDMRTLVSLLAKEETRGYCAINPEIIPDYNENAIIKHQPTWDCVLDAMMLLSCL